MMLGPFGWMTLAMVVRTPRAIARDRVTALPFPVTHDPPFAIDGWTRRVAMYGATITLRRAADGVEAEQIARTAELAAPGFAVRIADAAITLAPRDPRANHLVLLADLMSTWGLELHASHGITGLAVAWRPPTGPPPSL